MSNEGVRMVLRHLVFCAVVAAGSSAAYAVQVPSAEYNGLSYGRGQTHAGPAVRVARPGRFQRSDEHRHHGDERHHGGDSGGYGS